MSLKKAASFLRRLSYLKFPVAELRGNESRKTGMSSTGFSTGSAIN